uniref:PB1 domain-containing protein n=1 Tax=Pyramimonas obovata TaxID=1411642 RepID=A0A7S0MRM9_9CHLO|mmetsp:Transcript_11679/g.24438  ORF Transcript_11679/g.24438 Transcript_11679/m.24438 type:complete len:402 (+) Transcript_11679:157-1362(+)
MAFVRVKCDLEGDIRRFSLEEPLAYDELKKHLETIYEMGELVIKYKDDEDDLVTIASERDLVEARTCVQDSFWRLKLFVKEPSKKEKKEKRPEETVTKGDPLWLLKQYKKAQKAQWKEVKQVNKEVLNMKPWKAQSEKQGNPVKQMARFVDHVTLQEGEKIPAGERCTKTWRVRNDSPRAWPDGPIELVYVSGKASDRLTPQDAYPVEAKLAPGEETELSVEITAPTAPGLYQGFWRLRGPKGCKFGQRLGCSVLVKDDEAVISDSDHDSSEEDVVASEDEDSDGFVDLGSSNDEQQPIPNDKWAKELAALRQAGFDNDKLSLKMLKKCNGNVAKVAKKLAKKNLKCVKKVTKTVKKLEDLTLKQAKLFASSNAPPEVDVKDKEMEAAAGAAPTSTRVCSA